MNRVVALERARGEVSAAQVRCRESYDRCGGGSPEHIFWSAGDFHQHCQLLRQAENTVRLLELRTEPSNDTGPQDVFDMNYPRAITTGDLVAALDRALPPIDRQRLRVETVYMWEPRSDGFREVAHWARVENAWRAHQLRLPTPGMTLPPRSPMPVALADALSVKLETRAKKTRAKKAAP